MIELGEEIGRGGHAVVHEGLDPGLNRRVAVKILHPHYQADPKVSERFRDEGRKMAAVNHPNVLQVYSITEVDGRDALLMELAEGTLRDESRTGGLPAERVVEILTAVASGLGEMARGGLYHRDVKPSNVLKAGGTWKVGDLGVARGELEDPTMLEATPRYLAPEVLAGMKSAPAAPDLYSLGLIAYELVLGEERVDELVRQSLNAPPGGQLNWLSWQMSPVDLPPLDEVEEGVPAGLARIAGRLVHKDPGKRHSDYESLLADLAGWREAGGAGADAAAPGAEATVLRDRKPGERVGTLLDSRPGRAAPAAGDEIVRPRAPEPPPEPPARDETEESDPRRRLLLAAVAVMVLGGLAWAFWPAGGPSLPPMDFVSDPPGAAVVVAGDGRVLGTTPYRHAAGVPPGVEFRFELKGHEPATALTVTGSSRVEVRLEPLPAPVEELAPEDALPTAAELARRILTAGSPAWSSQLIAVDPADTSRRLSFPVGFGREIQYRLASPREGWLTAFHLGQDGTLTQIVPHLMTGNQLAPAGKMQVLPSDPVERITTTPPAGREWFFVVVTDSPLLPPQVHGSLAMYDRWRAYPLSTTDGSRPAVAFVEWLERQLGPGSQPFSLAHLEYEVVGEGIQ